eukprot:26447-Pyramimonas_sp.AAC.1
MLLSGLASGVHIRVEKLSTDLPKKLDALAPDRALLETLKDTSMGCVERSQKMASNVPHLHETVNGLNISTLSRTMSEMEDQDNATREEREQVSGMDRPLITVFRLVYFSYFHFQGHAFPSR